MKSGKKPGKKEEILPFPVGFGNPNPFPGFNLAGAKRFMETRFVVENQIRELQRQLDSGSEPNGRELEQEIARLKNQLMVDFQKAVFSGI